MFDRYCVFQSDINKVSCSYLFYKKLTQYGANSLSHNENKTLCII